MGHEYVLPPNIMLIHLLSTDIVIINSSWSESKCLLLSLRSVSQRWRRRLISGKTSSRLIPWKTWFWSWLSTRTYFNFTLFQNFPPTALLAGISCDKRQGHPSWTEAVVGKTSGLFCLEVGMMLDANWVDVWKQSSYIKAEFSFNIERTENLARQN